MVNKFGSGLTDLLFRSLMNMREHGILNVNFNVPKDTISIIDSEGTLILHPNKRSNPDDIVHYDFSS